MFIASQYDPSLVILSLIVSTSGADVALSLAERISSTVGLRRNAYVGSGACVMGIAIWSMHYVGMLALQLPIIVRYDLPLVLLSIAIAILASALAFLLTAQRALSSIRLWVGSLAMGSGIAAMHYVGMAAMRMQCVISWNLRIVALSVLIAVLVSAGALTSLRSSSRIAGYRKLLAVLLLGGGISSMHYVGMAAAHFHGSINAPDFAGTLSVSTLGAIGIAATSIVLFAVARGGSFIGKYLSDQSEKLETAEGRYQLLFEKSLLGIYRMGSDGLVIGANDAAARMLGYAHRRELIGVNLIARHLNETDGQCFYDSIQRASELPPREMKLTTKDGKSTYMLHSATAAQPLPSGNGEVQGFFLSIDEQKRAEHELLKAHLLAESGNIAKRNFMSKMSHELRTPLNGILGMAELLLETPVSEEQKEYLLSIQQCGEGLLASISAILHYADESSPKPDSQWEEFDFRDLLNSEIQAIKPKAERKGVTIESEIDDTCARRFFSDSHRLRHIIDTVLAKALKLTSAGEIRLSASSQSSRVGAYPMLTLTVSDGTKGGEARIGEPFVDTGLADANASGDIDFGLLAVRSAVSALHGTIAIETKPGEGSKLIVQLPLRPVAD